MSFKFCVVVDIEVTDKIGFFSKRGVAPRGCGTCEYTQNGHNSVILVPRGFIFCVVVDIEVTDQLGFFSKRGVAPRGRGTCLYTLK